MRSLSTVLLFAALSCGCDSSRPPTFRDASTTEGTDSGPTSRPDASSPADAAATPRPDTGVPVDPSCVTAAVSWIYLVDADDAFLRFNPETYELSEIGTLSCPTSGSPFSMSVDRDATAWVLHRDGRIYHVSTDDVSCTDSGFAPDQRGFELFGMGFVADAEGSSEETLFISGGAEWQIGTGGAELGSIEPSTLTVSDIGSLPGWPELTGTGDAELWGFFPDTRPPSVRQIDKTDGTTSRTFNLRELDSSGGGRAWAFAFWGGRFFIFYQSGSDASTNVWRLNPADGVLEEVAHDTGYRIVGAGVSTCAPVDLI